MTYSNGDKLVFHGNGRDPGTIYTYFGPYGDGHVLAWHSIILDRSQVSIVRNIDKYSLAPPPMPEPGEEYKWNNTTFHVYEVFEQEGGNVDVFGREYENDTQGDAYVAEYPLETFQSLFKKV